MRIEKEYYSLPEILRRWSIEEDDLIYLAENNQVRLSIRVFNQLWSLATMTLTSMARGFGCPMRSGCSVAFSICTPAMSFTSFAVVKPI